MKVPTKAKIEAVCSKDATRPLLCSPHLRIGKDGLAWLEATNTYVLARIPVEIPADQPEPDTAGSVPLEAIKASRKAGAGQGLVYCNGTASVPYGASWPRENLGKYPDVPALIPSYGPDVTEVRLNAAYLHAAAQAMGTDELVLQIPSAVKQPIRLQPVSGRGVEGAEGLLMQIRRPS